MKLETRGVLAGVYPRRYAGSMLTHAVEVNADGYAVRVLCRRVQVDSLADGGRDPQAPPTCYACLRLWDRARYIPK
jgi:hypothetical protein